MKKYVLLLLAAFSLSFTAQAQLADGSIAPDFTATDINGVEHNLYDLLDQGKSVVLDVSATWCGPCWNYHTGGILEQLWEEHGPDGADDIYVFMIEGDATTGQADLEGTTSGTWGDWITGTGYPIIDDASLSDLYEISYYPTIYHVCPNRIVTEIGQASSVAAYVNQTGTCEAASGVNNSAILSYDGFEGAACGDVVFAPSVMIQNLGTEEMTAATIELAFDGNVVETINWTGSLATFQTEIITFGEVTATTSLMTISIVDVNGNADDDAGNNIFTSDIGSAPLVETDTVVVEILTDNYGNETYWAVLDDQGLVIADGGNAGVGFTNTGVGAGAPPADPGAYGNGTTYTTEVEVPADGCYTLVVTDYWGDGVCCDYGTGYYKLLNSAGEELLSGGAFAARTDEPFEKAAVVSNEEVLVANKFEVYPNPVSDNLTVEFGLLESTKVSFQVINAIGQVVHRDEVANLAAGEHIVSLDMNRLQAGIYFVNLVTEHGITSQRVIKQ